MRFSYGIEIEPKTKKNFREWKWFHFISSVISFFCVISGYYYHCCCCFSPIVRCNRTKNQKKNSIQELPKTISFRKTERTNNNVNKLLNLYLYNPTKKEKKRKRKIHNSKTQLNQRQKSYRSVKSDVFVIRAQNTKIKWWRRRRKTKRNETKNISSEYTKKMEMNIYYRKNEKVRGRERERETIRKEN